MNQYENPLITKYSSIEMSYNFSPKKKFITWRKLWITLAEVQKELGINISEEQIQDLKNHLYQINLQKINFYEKKFHHDVIAHIYAYGELATKAKSIIHLGVTSAFIVDNTDLIQMRDGLKILLNKLICLIYKMKIFILKYKDLPTLGFTHFQPALLTTVGKRTTLWLQSLIMDLQELEFRLQNLKFRGVKGAVGSANSFYKLFEGNLLKFNILNQRIAQKFDFDNHFIITGQTYDRKIDAYILQIMSNIAQSAHKFSNDIRLLQNLKEIEEPFEEQQIGSSAMAYKRNPIMSERISSLAKYIISIANSANFVAATQWLERTLDDSANKRITIAQTFLATDAILLLWNNIIQNLMVYPKMINKHINQELPFIITEDIILQKVKDGHDRQIIHERLRHHAMLAEQKMKKEGLDNDFINRIINDKTLNLNKDKIFKMLNPYNYIGFSIEQIIEFIKNDVDPILLKYKNILIN